MKNKKIIIIVLFLLLMAFVGILFGYKMIATRNNKLKKEESDKISNFDRAIDIANSSYGGESKNVDIVEKDNGYEITVTDKSTNKVLNKFLMDKKTYNVSEIFLNGGKKDSIDEVIDVENQKNDINVVEHNKSVSIMTGNN